MLVHAGTGGVGLASIHLGKAAGSTVLSTAGSSSKRAHLRSMGVNKAASSRDTSFTDVLASGSGTLSGQLHPYSYLCIPAAMICCFAESRQAGA